jgi:ATP-dependent DNA helicase PIF1
MVDASVEIFYSVSRKHPGLPHTRTTFFFRHMAETASELTPEQANVLALLRDGHNVFLTGGGGVGKSFVIHAAVNDARCRQKVVAITAPTGVAAELIGGGTLHSLLGLGLAKDDVEKTVASALKSGKIKNRWMALNLLVIDEVSMLSPDLFTKVDAVARAVRRQPHRPFGGIQLLLCGDFFQLPPVLNPPPLPHEPTFCFQTDVWVQCGLRAVQLTQTFRQLGDSRYAEMLNRLRFGDYNADDIDLLCGRVDAALVDFVDIVPTRLYARRINVDQINHDSLAALGEVETEVYNAAVHWELDVPKGVRIQDNKRAQMTHALQQVAAGEKHVVSKELTLKVGAQVMLVCNLDVENGLVNGSRGVVINFVQPDDGRKKMPVVKFMNGTEMMVNRFVWETAVEGAGTVFYRQVPLTLAWALTIHKAQGVSLDCAEIQLDDSVFAQGQAYVALSRVRTLNGLRLVSFKRTALKVHPLVKQFYSALDAATSTPASQAHSVGTTSPAPASSASRTHSPTASSQSLSKRPCNPFSDSAESKKARPALF